MKVMRHYQQTAVDSVLARWERYRSTVLVMATGTGKTVVGSEIIRRRSSAGIVLWLAHRDELIKQARAAIVLNTGLSVGIEKAEQRACIDGLWGTMDDVVVASVQTLSTGDRLNRFKPGSVATIIIDEAHHATAASYRKIVDYFPYAQVVGLTATPDRGDKVGLCNVFDDPKPAFEYDILTGINEGFLAEIVQHQVTCSALDLSRCRVTAGDLNGADLEKAMMVDAALHEVASPLVRLAGERPTVIFTVSVDQAHAMTEVLSGYTSAKIRAISGKTPPEERERILRDYESGEVQFLVNCNVLTEGWDGPRTACVAVARPTKSRALYAQMLGRGTRLHPGKTNCLALDFVANSDTHDLATPDEALYGRPLPPEIKKIVQEMVERGMPTHEALAKAQDEARERAARAAAAAARAAKVQAEIAYRTKLVDPFGQQRDTGGGSLATDKQIEYLRDLGVDIPAKRPTAREASRVIDGLVARQKKGLCTHKQAKKLVELGLNPDVTRVQAGQILAAYDQAGRRVTPELKARFGVQGASAA